MKKNQKRNSETKEQISRLLFNPKLPWKLILSVTNVLDEKFWWKMENIFKALFEIIKSNLDFISEIWNYYKSYFVKFDLQI